MNVKLQYSKNIDCNGLGLYLTKINVENLGGVLKVHSSYGSGSEFIICFNEEFKTNK
jgi:signal transduction histidine kinase